MNTNTSLSGTSSTGSGNLVTGLFPDRTSAEAAYNAAHTRGYSKDDVNLVMSDDTRKRHFSDDSSMGTQTELGSKAAEGAGIGGAIGGTIGAILASIAAVGTSIALPGLGLVIAGPLAAAVVAFVLTQVFGRRFDEELRAELRADPEIGFKIEGA